MPKFILKILATHTLLPLDASRLWTGERLRNMSNISNTGFGECGSTQHRMCWAPTAVVGYFFVAWNSGLMPERP
jgi:hypothetical protein